MKTYQVEIKETFTWLSRLIQKNECEYRYAYSANYVYNGKLR
mgnify:CR=1 FL=1